MRVAILAGGFGARLAEETTQRPKPLVPVGGRPILWHIMMRYAAAGFRDFLVATGYKGEMIRDYLRGMESVDASGTRHAQRWRIEAVDTGLGTRTGGRLNRIRPHLSGGTFMLSWADGVSDVDLRALESFHKSHGRLATLVAVHPPPRFGRIAIEDDRVTHYAEKPPNPDEWISAGIFVLEPEALGFIAHEGVDWEREPLERLAQAGQLMAFRHEGFWHCMDTPAERDHLETLWRQNNAPWKTW